MPDQRDTVLIEQARIQRMRPLTTSSPSTMWPRHSSADHSLGLGRTRRRSPAPATSVRSRSVVAAPTMAGSSSPRNPRSSSR